jgi:CRISPR/Cas system CMR-associated protein Cmr3 (group 5 of RAMP superfamily)
MVSKKRLDNLELTEQIDNLDEAMTNLFDGFIKLTYAYLELSSQVEQNRIDIKNQITKKEVKDYDDF